MAPNVRPWAARFGAELDWEKLWRDQKMTDKWKETLAPNVRPWAARFGAELDWEKLWRDQVFGAKMTETNWIRIGKSCGGPLLHAARTHASVEPQATATYEPLWRWLTMSRSCSLRPSEWAPKVDHGRPRLRLEKATRSPGPRGPRQMGIQRQRLGPNVLRFGAELDWEKLWRDQVFGAKILLFFRGSVWHPKCDHGRLVLDQN